jgi:hypothetical protein
MYLQPSVIPRCPLISLSNKTLESCGSALQAFVANNEVVVSAWSTFVYVQGYQLEETHTMWAVSEEMTTTQTFNEVLVSALSLGQGRIHRDSKLTTGYLEQLHLGDQLYLIHRSVWPWLDFNSIRNRRHHPFQKTYPCYAKTRNSSKGRSEGKEGRVLTG